MLQLSSAAILEKNKVAQDGVWLTLLELQAPDSSVIRLCHNNEKIVWNNYTWTEFPFIIDSIKQTKTELPSIPVKISNVTKAMEPYIEQYGGMVGCTVILRVVNSKFGSRVGGVLTLTGQAEVDEEFVIMHTSSDAEWVTFNLGGALPLMKRFPFRRILKDWCPFEYKGIECASLSTNPTCTHTLQGCRDNGNSLRFGGEPSMAQGGLYASNS